MKKISKVIGIVGIALLTTLGVWHAMSAQRLAPTQKMPFQFKGDFLAIADADMVATGYANGISNKVTGIEDSLFYVSALEQSPIATSRLHVSNSVISWPAILEWSSSGRLAYVAETRAMITSEDNQMKDVFADYPVGKHLTVIDFSTPEAPVILQQRTLGENLQNVSINKAGDLLAAGSTEEGKEGIIATLRDGLIDQVFYFTDPEIEAAKNKDRGFRTLEFHPTEDVLAVNLNGNYVAFYRVNRSAGQLSVERLGSSIAAGKKLSVGNWHPNGKYFLVADVAWGDGPLGAVFNSRGKLITVAFDPKNGHSVVSKTKVGLSPEGFDVSPDGKYAIAVNMRRTYLPKALQIIPGRKRASLTLLKINPDSGKTSPLGQQYGFSGVLPEDAIFDQESNSIAVAVYHDQDISHPSQGWIDFWEIRDDQLIKTDTKLSVTRGVHNLLLIPQR